VMAVHDVSNIYHVPLLLQVLTVYTYVYTYINRCHKVVYKYIYVWTCKDVYTHMYIYGSTGCVEYLTHTIVTTGTYAIFRHTDVCMEVSMHV
jgi:hypothetical protein